MLDMLIVILLLFLPGCELFLRSNYKKMLNKAKDYYKSHLTDKSKNVLGYDGSEYPGTNPLYIQDNKKKWEEYYACLNLQDGNVGQEQSFYPEAIVGFEGGVVSFDCKICLSPEERNNIEAVEWYWGPVGLSHLILVEYNEHVILSPDDKKLSLYNLAETHTGQYNCKLGSSTTSPYFLTVLNSNTNISEVHPKSAKQGPYPEEQYYIASYNLMLDTVWSKWSHCSVCGKTGKRHKLGFCFIYNAEMVDETEVPLITDIPNRNKDELAFVNLFRNGFPCLSHVLPDSIKNLPEVKNRTSEIMIGYCKEPCANDVIFEVKDKSGNVIEKVNNSGGIYSMLQGIPPIEPSVERRLIYEKRGARIVLSCPENLNVDTPIQWQISSKTLVPELIARQSNRRIFITVSDKLTILHAKISDSNIYSCWQNNELVGTIRLVIEQKLILTFNHHIMLIGIVIILSVFVYVFAKAFLGRKYAKV